MKIAQIAYKMNELEKNSIVNTPESVSLLTYLKFALNATGDINKGINVLKIDKKFGTGAIKSIDLDNGMSIIEFDLLLFNDFSFELDHDDSDHLYFFYGLEGICYHNFRDKEKYTIIEELKTSIVGSSKKHPSVITIKKNIQFKYNIISIEKQKYFKKFQKRYNPSEEKIEKLHKAFNVLNTYVYQCSHNLKISEQLRLLRNNNIEFNITNLMHLESHFKIILSHHIEQFYKEIYEERVVTSLTKTELQKIRKITDYIIDNPMLHHTIRNLCSQAILSPVKLQEGFRCMHGTTVSNYIKNVRVEKARDLLIYSDHNVSEIAYMVGFTSRSYFCKIFKEKFGCNATAYRNKYKDKTVALKNI